MTLAVDNMAAHVNNRPDPSLAVTRDLKLSAAVYPVAVGL